MQDLEQILRSCYSQNLEQRKHWYGSVADDYNKVRPRYPQNLTDRVVELAQLSSDATILEVGCGPSDATILEVGCGPGNATISFARLGFSIVCLEPNPEFCRLVQHNCQEYPLVKILNISLEEWQLEASKFDVVLAANSWHWIPPEVKYSKSAQALRDNGFLILLWNMTPEPNYEAHAPSLTRYEGREMQEEILRGFGQNILDSGLFRDLISEQIPCNVSYSTDDYLMLLNTFSQYRAIAPQTKNSLFEGLKDKLESQLQGSIELSYLSAFHLARKL
jgi:SAM-dependent methyltransferase